MDSTATIGWGVLAPGRIAHNFVRDLTLVPDARLVANGSRSLDRAEAFAAQHGGRAHGSYAELVADPEVDVVYVASPHALHEEHTMLALDAGKPVLCEKPMTLDAAATGRLVAAAEERGLFLMEAMWMACNPLVLALVEGLRSGRFGRPRQVHADLGFVVDRPPEDRLLNRDLGGGALLDMGVYPLTFADLVLGPAARLTAVAGVSEAGIDLDVAIAGEYAGGAVAALTASMTSCSPRTASIATDTGRIDVAADFHHPTTATWTPAGGEPEPVAAGAPLLGSGLGNEAAEVQRCLAEGLRESPLVPHERTLRLMAQMDDLRRQVGVSYPAEEAGSPT